MSRCLKCSCCGDEILIGERYVKTLKDERIYCQMCTTTDILDESDFEEDDSHAVIEERYLNLD